MDIYILLFPQGSAAFSTLEKAKGAAEREVSDFIQIEWTEVNKNWLWEGRGYDKQKPNDPANFRIYIHKAELDREF